MTISAFNHIRGEEHADNPPQWLGTALCYAALAGGHPESPLTTDSTAEQKFQLAMPAELDIRASGNVTLSFAEVSAAPRPKEWTMIFDRKGKLLKATRGPAELIPAKVVHPEPMVVTGRAVPLDPVLPNPGGSR